MRVGGIESVYEASVVIVGSPLSWKYWCVGDWCELDVGFKSLSFSIVIGWLSYGVLVIASYKKYVLVKVPCEDWEVC